MKKLLLALMLLPLFAQGQFIFTYAGDSSAGYNGDNIPAVTAELNMPAGIVADGAGNIYFTDLQNQRVRKVNTNGIITTLAGTGIDGADCSGLADTSKLYQPFGIAINSGGDLFFSTAGHLVRVTPFGIISNIAGGGTNILASGVQANTVEIGQICGIAVDPSGNVYFSDTYHYRVCKVNTSGILTTIAGTGASGYSGDNGPATDAQVSEPYGITLDGSGNIYIADYGNSRVRVINPFGYITSVVGNGTPGNSGDGGLGTHAQLYAPTGIAFDNSGDMYISDYYNANVRKVNTSGIISTVAGTGVPGYSGDNNYANAAQLSSPYGIAADPSGYVYIADYGNSRIRQIGLTTGVNNVQMEKYADVKIFPNPATAQVNITSTQNITNITITNLLGQTMYTHEYNMQMVPVDVSGLPVGVYFVKVNGSAVRKFVKE